MGIINYLKDQLAGNPFFSGALTGGVLLGILHQVRTWPGLLYRWVLDRITIELNVDVVDRLYPYFRQWVSKLKYDRFTQSYYLLSQNKDANTYYGNDASLEPFLYPAAGNYYVNYKNCWILLRSNKSEPEKGNQGFTQVYESVSLRFFRWNHHILDGVMEDIKALKSASEEQGVHIYIAGESMWNKNGVLPFKDPSTVVTDGILEELLADVRKFRGRKDWYIKNGIPYRRGYCLYGPAGTGKTSCVYAIASEFKLPVYCLSYSKDTEDTKFRELISELPSKSILLMEDIDCFFEGRESSSSTSFSTLINCLDGLIAKHDILMFMTTNHLDKLDPALIRPGRVDMKKEFKLAGKDQISKLYQLFYDKDGTEFAVSCPEITPAELQNYFQQHHEPKTFQNRG